MGSHLTISYRHNRATGEPLFAGNQIAQCVAHDVRQQLTRGDDRVLAIDLERLTRVRAMRVNDITYELEWSTDAPVSDDRGKPVLGVCEVDPDGLPDTALICVNPDPVEGRTELLLSTGAHEMGHGIFEAPAWIYAHQRSSMPDAVRCRRPGGAQTRVADDHAEREPLLGDLSARVQRVLPGDPGERVHGLAADPAPAAVAAVHGALRGSGPAARRDHRQCARDRCFRGRGGHERPTRARATSAFSSSS